VAGVRKICFEGIFDVRSCIEAVEGDATFAATVVAFPEAAGLPA